MPGGLGRNQGGDTERNEEGELEEGRTRDHSILKEGPITTTFSEGTGK